MKLPMCSLVMLCCWSTAARSSDGLPYAEQIRLRTILEGATSNRQAIQSGEALNHLIRAVHKCQITIRAFPLQQEQIEQIRLRMGSLGVPYPASESWNIQNVDGRVIQFAPTEGQDGLAVYVFLYEIFLSHVLPLRDDLLHELDERMAARRQSAAAKRERQSAIILARAQQKAEARRQRLEYRAMNAEIRRTYWNTASYQRQPFYANPYWRYCR